VPGEVAGAEGVAELKTGSADEGIEPSPILTQKRAVPLLLCKFVWQWRGLMASSLAVSGVSSKGATIDWQRLARQCRRLLPARAVIAARQELLAYDCDGLTLHRYQPPLVVLPETTEQVAAVVRLCHDQGTPSWPGAAAPASPVVLWLRIPPW